MATVRICGGFGNPMPNWCLEAQCLTGGLELPDALGVVDLVEQGLLGFLQMQQTPGQECHPVKFGIEIPSQNVRDQLLVDHVDSNILEPVADGIPAGPAAGFDRRMHVSGSSEAHSKGHRVPQP